MTRTLFLSILFLGASTSAALAHGQAGEATGFGIGFGHPLGGLDHVLAMVAVGLFAATLGGRALWAVPLTFLAVMAVGGALGMAGVSLPFVETGIALSIIVLGLVVALRWQAPLALAMMLVGGLALFHGHAHGTEMPTTAAGASYALGFLLGTALLHLAGLGLGLLSGRLIRAEGPTRTVSRVTGSVFLVLGVGVLTGLL